MSHQTVSRVIPDIVCRQVPSPVHPVKLQHGMQTEGIIYTHIIYTAGIFNGPHTRGNIE